MLVFIFFLSGFCFSLFSFLSFYFLGFCLLTRLAVFSFLFSIFLYVFFFIFFLYFHILYSCLRYIQIFFFSIFCVFFIVFLPYFHILCSFMLSFSSSSLSSFSPSSPLTHASPCHHPLIIAVLGGRSLVEFPISPTSNSRLPAAYLPCSMLPQTLGYYIILFSPMIINILSSSSFKKISLVFFSSHLPFWFYFF